MGEPVDRWLPGGRRSGGGSRSIFAGQAAWYHIGDNPGYRSIACWIPEREASIVILVNDEAASITGLLRQLLPAVVKP